MMSISAAITVEISATNVDSWKEALHLTEVLKIHFRHCKINIDLHDNDKILRVEGVGLLPFEIIALVKEKGFHCSRLE